MNHSFKLATIVAVAMLYSMPNAVQADTFGRYLGQFAAKFEADSSEFKAVYIKSRKELIIYAPLDEEMGKLNSASDLEKIQMYAELNSRCEDFARNIVLGAEKLNITVPQWEYTLIFADKKTKRPVNLGVLGNLECNF